MKYSDTTNKTGILQKIERYINMGDAYISGDATRLKEFTADINEVSKDIWHLIFMSSGNWKYDDSNQTDLPQAAVNLVSGTSKYQLPEEALTIARVEIANSAGTFSKITPIAESDIVIAVSEFQTDGTPIYYRLLGTTIELFPNPNYAYTSGLKVYFDRTSFDFVVADTTKTPGFASPYHLVLAIDTAINWLEIKNPAATTLPNLIIKSEKYKGKIKEYYQNRFKDYKVVIRPLRENFK